MLLHHYMEFYAREIPNSPCVEMEDVVYDYGAANAHCNQVAYGLVAHGMQKGDRIAWLSKNCLELLFIFYAGSKVGAVPTPINYRLAPPEWQYIINDSGAKVLVCEDELAEGVEKVRGALAHIEHFVLLDGEREGWVSFADWIGDQPESNPEADITEADDLYQMYTSGTTGLPKGAVLSQRAIDSNTRMMATALGIRTRDTRVVVPLPMYHAAAGITIKGTITVGGSLIIQRDFDPVAVVDAIEHDGVSNCTLVPAMIQACLVMVPNIKERSFPNLRGINYGASPIAVETLRQAMEVFGCKFRQVFGMTETTAIATVLLSGVHERAVKGEEHLLLSCGRAAPGTLVKIVDDDGNEVPTGEVGEIAVKGPQLLTQYWNLPEATEKSLRNGWLFTGDAAKMDEEGFVYIQDRIKDMIVTGGENVYPKEVENALFEHPNVADAAVIGIPDEKYGEAIMAFITTRDGETIDTDELITFCRDQLAGYKVPRQFEFIPEIPRNPSGKALKKDLREPYWKGIERRVG